MKKTKVFLSFILCLCVLLPLCSLTATAASGKWVSSWATSTVNGSVTVSALSLQDVIPARSTIRTELTVTTGGSKLRFKFSNEYGKSAITIGAASVAKNDTKTLAKIVDGTQTDITFDGKTSVTIPAGETVWSDNIKFKTSALDKISVSLFFENLTYITSTGLSNGRTFLATGSSLLRTASKVNTVTLTGSTEVNISSGTITYHTIPFLSRIDTYSGDENACSAVFIGDSTLVNDTYLYYAEKVVNAGVTNIGIVNEAIIGNKLLSDGTGLIGNLCGEAMIDRFERDALEAAGVKYIFVKIGLNDILHQYTNSLKSATPKHDATDIINGYKKLVNMAHEKGIKIYFFTKSAWNGYERSFLGQTGDLTWNAEAQAMCDELDKWIKSDNESDGYIDCSPLADPSDTTRLCPTFTLDGAHLTTLGSIALADLIPLSYLDINVTNAKTAAQIEGVDPYKEKRQIESDMKNKASEAEVTTTKKSQESTTSKSKSETTTQSAATTAQAVTASQYVPTTAATPEVTVPYTSEQTSDTEETTASVSYYDIENATQQEAKYVVNDTDTDSEVDSIGTNVPIGFILVLIASTTAAGVLVILTIGKKKEHF